MTKTQFILSQPLDIPAAEVVAAARKAGLTFAPAYVHVTRHKARQAGKVPSTPERFVEPANDLARDFDRLALRLGYDAARERVERLLEVSV